MKTRIIGLLLIGLLFSSCPEKYYAVHVQNLTDHKIRFYTAIDVVHMYPDTLINPTELGQPVHPNSTGTRGGGVPWEDKFKLLPADTLSIFIFDFDTLDTYSWDVVRDEYKVLKRYDLSLQDLKALNYTLSYPPGVEMQNMKMYPPYVE